MAKSFRASSKLTTQLSDFINAHTSDAIDEITRILRYDITNRTGSTTKYKVSYKTTKGKYVNILVPESVLAS